MVTFFDHAYLITTDIEYIISWIGVKGSRTKVLQEIKDAAGKKIKKYNSVFFIYDTEAVFQYLKKNYPNLMKPYDNSYQMISHMVDISLSYD